MNYLINSTQTEEATVQKLQKMPAKLITTINVLINKLTDFNGISTCQGLFYA